MFKEPATRMANQLGLEYEQFFFGLETLLAVVGLLSGILALTVLGFLSNYVLGKFFISTTEKVLDKVPFLSTVYRSVKQIVETFGKDTTVVRLSWLSIPERTAGFLVLLRHLGPSRPNRQSKRKSQMYLFPPLLIQRAVFSFSSPMKMSSPWTCLSVMA